MQRRLIERQLSCSKAAILWIIVWNRTDPQARQLWIQTTYLSVVVVPKEKFKMISFQLQPGRFFAEQNLKWCFFMSDKIEWKLSPERQKPTSRFAEDLTRFSIEKTRKKSKTHLKYRNIYPVLFLLLLKLIARSIITWDIYWSVRVLKYTNTDLFSVLTQEHTAVHLNLNNTFLSVLTGQHHNE